MRLHIMILLPCLLAISCRKPQPQLPANKPIRKETPALDLAKVNKEMIQHEDSMLTVFVAESGLDLQKTSNGFWYRIDKSTAGKQLKLHDACVVDYRLLSCDGTLLETVQGMRLVIGKKEIITGLDDALLLMRPGENATFLFPWHLAYGMKGYRQLVPPYTSVMMQVEVH